MGFSYFVAVIGVVVSTALIGFTAGGAHESEHTTSTAPRPETTPTLLSAGLALAALTQSMVLFGSGLIQPAWVMYLLLAVLPATAGFIARRVLARQFSRRSS